MEEACLSCGDMSLRHVPNVGLPWEQAVGLILDEILRQSASIIVLLGGPVNDLKKHTVIGCSTI